MHGVLANLPSISAVRKRAPKRKLSDARRRALVEKVANALRIGDPTIFRFEASCRAGLRTMFCLQGIRWALADLEAAEIVAAALRQLGARRPTWYEGQPDVQELHGGRMYCGNPKCRKPIGRGWRAGYCSEDCRQTAKSGRRYHSNAERLRAAAAARRVAYQAAQPEVQCPICETMFRPKPPNGSGRIQRYCGIICRNRAGTLAKAALRKL